MTQVLHLSASYSTPGQVVLSVRRTISPRRARSQVHSAPRAPRVWLPNTQLVSIWGIKLLILLMLKKATST